MFNYDLIPDGPEEGEIIPALHAFLDEKEQLIEEKGLSYTLDQLEKIAEKEIYEDYPEYWIKGSSDFLIDNLKDCRYDDVDLILTITAQMGLGEVWKYIKRKRKFFE